MLKVGKTRLLVCILVALIVTAFAATTASAGLFGGHKSRKSAKKNIVRQTMVVFPFDQSSDVKVPDKYGSELASYLRSSFNGSPAYWVIIYSETLSPIQRGKADNSLKKEDMDPPYNENKAKSLLLAQTLAADCYMIGSIDDFQFDRTKKLAVMTVSAELVSAKTGKTIQQFTVGGKADESSSATEEDEFRAVAAGKVVDALKEKLVALTEPEPAPAPAPAPKKK